MDAQQVLADLIFLHAQRLELAMLADIAGDRLAHLLNAVPSANALGEIVGDLRLLLNANLFQRDVIVNGLAAKLLVVRVVAVIFVE